jgi:hypothetical protein
MTTETTPAASHPLHDLLRTENAGPVERLAALLRETEKQHNGRPAADWPRWYAAFMSERQLGASVADAQAFADRYTIGQPT